MILSIEHRTTYTYTEPVNYTIQQFRLTPQDGFGQRVRQWEIRANGNLHQFKDAYSNIAHTLVIDGTHEGISILASGEVETGLDIPPQDTDLPLTVFLRETPLTAMDDKLRSFAEQFVQPIMGIGIVNSLMSEITDRVKYVKGSTEIETTASKAFALGNGVCQDQAHILIACCRHLGFPARYVSGYLFTEDGSLMESHAWADVWVDSNGWQSFDISNRCRTNGDHVRLATGLDYRDACPVSGMRVGGGKETMSVLVEVKQSQQSQQQ